MVGAGLAGLTAAEELRTRGYRDVTVIEAKGRVGGKVFSFEHAPAAGGPPVLCEGGMVWRIPSPVYDRYAARYGLAGDHAETPRIRLLDLSSGRISSPYLAASRFPPGERAAQLVRFLARIGSLAPAGPGFADERSRALATPARRWFDENRLGYVREALGPLADAAQFGPPDEELPALYVVALLALLDRFGLARKLTLRLPRYRLGNQELWRRVAAGHRLLLGRPVTALEREDGVRLRAGGAWQEFDALVWTAPTGAFLAAAGDDASPEERDVLSRVRTRRRAVLTCRVEGLPEGLMCVVRSGDGSPLPRATPYVFFEVQPGSRIHNFYPYLEGGETPEELLEGVREAVRRAGGRGAEPVGAPLHWSWFPHFSSADVAAGIYSRLEALQGQRRTWFAGELFAGVSGPLGMEYAEALVERMIARAQPASSARWKRSASASGSSASS